MGCLPVCARQETDNKPGTANDQQPALLARTCRRSSRLLACTARAAHTSARGSSHISAALRFSDTTCPADATPVTAPAAPTSRPLPATFFRDPPPSPVPASLDRARDNPEGAEALLFLVKLVMGFWTRGLQAGAWVAAVASGEEACGWVAAAGEVVLSVGVGRGAGSPREVQSLLLGMLPASRNGKRDDGGRCVVDRRASYVAAELECIQRASQHPGLLRGPQALADTCLRPQQV